MRFRFRAHELEPRPPLPSPLIVSDETLASYDCLYGWGLVLRLENEGRIEESRALSARVSAIETRILDALFRGVGDGHSSDALKEATL